MSNAFDLEYFNNHDFEEVTPEWILNLSEKIDKTWDRLNSKITGFKVFENRINSISITDMNLSGESKEFDVFNILPSEKEAKAYRILPKLLYWRNFYNEGWKPDWSNSLETKYCFEYYYYDNKFNTKKYWTRFTVFAFKTPEIRDKFLKDFKEELEIVKPLL